MKIKSLTLIIVAATLTCITACLCSTGCSPSIPTPTETPQAMTATLPPTSAPPTEIPPTPSEIPPTQDPNCTSEALFVADMTIPDNTTLSAGEAFVKTWKVRNTGTCTWNESYSLIFSNGDQMSSPLSIPLSETAPEETLQISVDLIAPMTNGAFTGIYQLKNANGEVFNIGALDHIWLKIIVENGTVILPPTSAVPVNTSAPPETCTPDRNAAYESEILTLINNARAAEGLPALSLNVQLQAAADAHSADMACNSLLSHTGSDGSSVSSRVAAQGYAASSSSEVIYAGGTAQDAFNWWMNDAPHRAEILKPTASEIGIGYAYLASSTYGGYFSVVFASP